MTRTRAARILTIAGIMVLTLAVCFLLLHWNENRMSLTRINDHLDAGGIRLGMAEEEVVHLWGAGQYVEGFGGYGRDYEDRKIRVSFSNDSDNDLYLKAGQLAFTNTDYSLFGVRVDDRRQDATEKIFAAGFKGVDYSPDTFENGEYVIMLSGASAIEEITIWFSDKDLPDRNY